MQAKLAILDLLIGAVLKLDAASGERQNVMDFIRSCYCGRVCEFDLEAALGALCKLNEDEQHALIAWAVANDTTPTPSRSRACA